MNALVEVDKLSRYYGDNCAVDEISFSLEKGHILGFLGPNGAGKSTTMKMVTGNLAPHQGSIKINGHDLIDQPINARQHLGYLPEIPPLYPDLSVQEYLEYCAKLHRLSGNSMTTAIHDAMQRCDLTQVAKRLIRNLSKGFQQRVGIAQAILHKPAVIILDEPTVGLDPIQIIDIRELIAELGSDHGIILCTHILPEVQAVCTDVQIINKGKLVYSASLNDEDNNASDRTSYEIELAIDCSSEQLTSYSTIDSAEKISDYQFIIQSTHQAADISQQLCMDNLGLKHFSAHQDSLESRFIDIIRQDHEHSPTSQEAP